jgi:diguanylate cyclase (GGDEF)-like protein
MSTERLKKESGSQGEELQDTPSRRLEDILGKDNVISAWLDMRQDGDPEVFITLAEKLSDSERAALRRITDTTIGLRDDLLERLSKLEAENAQLKSLSLRDDLTGLYNYRYFARQLKNEISMSNRTGRPFSLMMIDIDNFKTINDTIGHNDANNVMVNIADALMDSIRNTDIGCRYGGDEFAVIIPATYMHDSLKIAQRFKEALARIIWRKDEYITASIGLAEHDPGSGKTFEEFINTADKALYKAKELGKDRIFYFESDTWINESEMVSNEEKGALYKIMDMLD